MTAALTEKSRWLLADWLRYQEQLHPRSIELGLERVRRVALRLGLLERPPLTLTVGGTNGKGSSATLAALITQEAGYRTGLYTSPHLLRYNERVAIGGEQVTDAALCRAFAAIEEARAETPLTYFEFGTLAALWLFREAEVDLQVLEVGLGGRLDAVNIVDADAALVTNIGLDHRDWLGDDRESIGREKAGIYRAGRPSVCADEEPPGSLAGASLQLGREFRIEEGRGVWHWSGARRLRDLPMPGLPGPFQLRNAAGVLAALLAIPALALTDEHIRAALPKLRLPGRFQRIGGVILDVAHNAEAAQALAQNLLAEGHLGRLNFVLGMLSDKPVAEVVAALAALSPELHLASLPGPRGLSAADLAARLHPAGLKLHLHQDVAAALAAARRASETTVVTGSFLTVAAAAEILHG